MLQTFAGVMQTPAIVMQTPSKPSLLRKIAHLIAALAARASDLDKSVLMSGIRTNAAAVMLGVSPNTLRSWERRYGFPPPPPLARRPPPVRAH